jgi:hypothetical protein
METKDYILLVGIVISLLLSFMLTIMLMTDGIEGPDKVFGGMLLFFISAWVIGFIVFLFFKLLISIVNFYRQD